MKNRLGIIEDMLKEDPNDPFLLYALALELQKEGKKDQSLKVFQKLLHVHPKYLPTFYQLGKLLEEQSKPEEAIQIFKKGILVAEELRDWKTKNEIAEALMLLEPDEEDDL